VVLPGDPRHVAGTPAAEAADVATAAEGTERIAAKSGVHAAADESGNMTETSPTRAS
jgi:hypothetical protein